MRAHNIDKHFNTQFNILTGEDRNVLRIPNDKPKQFSHI